MRRARNWIVAMLLMASGAAAMAWYQAEVGQAYAQPRPPGDHWQNFDGHWSYWHEGDNRWYYTDGKHWYYHNGTGWVLYGFDKLFGTVNFLLGGYKPPPPAAVELPHHGVYRRP